MGTISVTSPQAYAPPPPEVLAPEIAAVQEYHENLEVAARALRISTMRIAFYGHRMRMTQGWVAFGYEEGPRGEEQYRESLGVPRSSWYKAVRIGQAFQQLSLEDLERIPVSNAEILLSVDPTLWHDYPWTFEAKTLQPEKLAELVTSRNRDIGNGREPLVTMAFRVPLLAHKSLNMMLESFQKRFELSSKSQAIEMLIADRYDRSNATAAIEKARRLIEGAALRMKHSKVKRANFQEEIGWLVMAMEVLDEARAQAIQAARETAEGDQEDSGWPGDVQAEPGGPDGDEAASRASMAGSEWAMSTLS